MGQIQMGAGNDRSGWRGGMAFSCAVADRRVPWQRREPTEAPNPLAVSSVFSRTPHSCCQPLLIGTARMGRAWAADPLLISGFAVGLRNFLFGQGVAFT